MTELRIARLAAAALVEEVYTTPKPGLVDLNNTGAHRDMTVQTFLYSAAALQPYFREMAELGRTLPFASLLPALRELGVDTPAWVVISHNHRDHGGGLFRFDLTPKPAYDVIKRLITEVWHTESDGTTDENGSADFRGFYGEYDIEIEANEKTEKKTVKLSKLGENSFTLTI